jgi:predicted ATP-binding protein involved in virulence
MCLYHGGLKLEKSDESHDKFVKSINTIILSDIRKRSSAQTNFGRNIDNVIRAIQQFIPEYSNLRIDRTGRGTAKMLVDKEGREFDIGQLSDGEKNLIALIGDIARRLTIANPNSNDPLSESGIILIDELDLHLHPKWQRIVITKITEVFPNCQFIVSSHSPQVISHVQSDEVFLLKNEDGNIVNYPVNHSYGKNSDRILEDVMDETARPKNIEEKIKNIFSAIQHGNISEARDLIAELQNCIGEDGDLIRANVLIKRMEMIGK